MTKPYYQDDSATLHHGDCLAVMPTIAESSVDAVVCDPPYGLSFMGKDWDHGVPGVHFWQEALRVAKPGAHLLAFGGTRTFHRLAVAIEDAGWEMRDTIGWLYGSGFPKSHNLKGQWSGWGTALKPAWEPIIVARKPLIGTVAENVLAHGTGAINVDGCRIATGDKLTSNHAGGTGNRENWRTGNKPGVHYTTGSTTGRWPANLIHDGSDEVVGLFPQTTSTPHTHNHKQETKVYGGGRGLGIRCGDSLYADSGSAARFFYSAKASRADRGEGNHHPTVKPTAMMRYLCRLVTPPGGIVLDPFMGSGSTGKAAVREGFRFVGIEMDHDYCEIAVRRVAQEVLPLGV